jgi:hypothetical protein
MNFRISCASEYLRALDISCQVGWVSAFNNLSTESTEFERLALIHPQHIADSNLPKHLNAEDVQRSLQGARSFGVSLGNPSCQASLVWGYECQLNAEIQQDHLFPYSLGGPTLALNRIHLCKYHNMVKTSDVHSYPWEQQDRWVGPWLTMQIAKLQREFFSLYA